VSRFLRRVALLAVLVGLGAWLKELLDRAEPSPATLSEDRAGDAAEKRPAPAASNGSKTKAELYDEAQRLGIEGRSKMSKAELERAIRDA
jgi:hypothetical protein